MERLGVVDSHFHRIQINFAPPRRFANFCGAGRTSLIWESENQWLDQKYIFIRNCSLESLPARICWSILSQNTFLKYKIHFFHFLTEIKIFCPIVPHLQLTLRIIFEMIMQARASNWILHSWDSHYRSVQSLCSSSANKMILLARFLTIPTVLIPKNGAAQGCSVCFLS